MHLQGARAPAKTSPDHLHFYTTRPDADGIDMPESPVNRIEFRTA